jgi:hypothetical protein
MAPRNISRQQSLGLSDGARRRGMPLRSYDQTGCSFLAVQGERIGSDGRITVPRDYGPTVP